MNQLLIKLVLLGLIGMITILALRAGSSARSRALWRLSGGAVALLATLSVIFPNALTRIANILGVARGADLLLYMLVISFMLAMVFLFRRLTELEAKVTTLVRHLAILQSELASPSDLETDEDSREC